MSKCEILVMCHLQLWLHICWDLARQSNKMVSFKANAVQLKDSNFFLISQDVTYKSQETFQKKGNFILHHIIKWGKNHPRVWKEKNNKIDTDVCSEGPHSRAKWWGSVRRCNSNVEIVSDLEALWLQRQGVVCAFPARHSTANVFQPVKWEQMHINKHSAQVVCFMYTTSVVEVWYQPVHFPSRVRVDNVKTEVGPLFPGLWIYFLHQASQLF